MDATSILLLITQIITLLAAALGFWNSRKARSEGRETKADIAQVHVLINSRLSKLLELTEKSARAEGRKAEKDNPS